MGRKELSALLMYSLVLWIGGAGLVPLLPLYATHLGATPALAGRYMAFAFAGMAMGTMVAGVLSDRFQRRRWLLVAAGIGIVPAVWLMGRVTSVRQLTVVTASVWFLGGMGLTLVGILAGLFAQQTERGKVFGLLGMMAPLGALIGGLTTGAMADRWSYPVLFAVLALVDILLPLMALLLDDPRSVPSLERPGTAVRSRSGDFYLLLLAGLLAATAGFMGTLGRSLAMDALGFRAAQITAVVAIGGTVTLPLPFLIGWLSDKLGRKRLMAVCYLAGATSLVVLARAVPLWQFWVVSILMSIQGVSGPVGQALVTDLVPPESLGRGISVSSGLGWIAAILGFAGTGLAIQYLGLAHTFLLGAFLAVGALVALIPVQDVQQSKDAGGRAPLSTGWPVAEAGESHAR